MASKLAAAKMASWSGVRAVIAAASRPDVLAGAVAGRPGVGTVVLPRARRLSARKLWIAFALPSHGRVTIDPGAVQAVLGGGRSLLAAGVTGVDGAFAADDAVEVVGPDGTVVAKGLVRIDSPTLRAMAGRRSSDLTDLADGSGEVVHADDLVVLPT
jgi:glutamate 5-kinase